MTEGKQATDYVENAGRAANVEVESVILEGNPAEEIINFAENNDIDLIVMGTHGITGIERFLLGSVAENVVRHSKKAVLIVRRETAENRLRHDFRVDYLNGIEKKWIAGISDSFKNLSIAEMDKKAGRTRRKKHHKQNY